MLPLQINGPNIPGGKMIGKHGNKEEKKGENKGLGS